MRLAPGLLVSLVGVILVAWVARRLLGARRVSTTKTVIAAVIGFAVGWSVGLLVDDGSAVEDSIIIGSVTAVLTTMVLIVAFELTAPRPTSGESSTTRRNPIRAARGQIDDAVRLREVGRIARRNGLGALLTVGGFDELPPDELGRRLRLTLEEAGGVYVKLGQLMSTRPDVLPPEALEELSRLQGDVEPTPPTEMEPHLADALGAPVDEVFDSFDWDPIGSASIGQVYRAHRRERGPVVVKVRRPGVHELVERDLGIVLRLADTLDRRTVWGRRYGVMSFAEEFAADLRRELDYRREVQHGRELAASFADEADIAIPAMAADLSSQTVLVMDLVEGQSVGAATRDGSRIAGGERLADALFTAQVGAIVRGDTFHADPHPGNVFLLPDGRLALIDFGSAARLDALERAAVGDILAALQLRDPTLLREAVVTVSDVGSDVDQQRLERALARLLADHLGPGKEPSLELIVDFLDIVRRFQIRLPGTVLGVFRALGTMEGTLRALAPGFSMIDAAQDLAGRQLVDESRPESLSEAVRDEVVTLAPILRRAPRHLDRIAGQLERGELTTRISIFSHARDVEVITTLVNRFILGFLGAALGLVSVLLFRTDGGPTVSGDLAFIETLGFLGLVAGAVLVMRVVMEILDDRR